MRKTISAVIFLCILIFGSNKAFASSDNLTLYFNESKREVLRYIYINDSLLVDAYTITSVFPFIVPGKGVWFFESEKKLAYADFDKDEYMVERLSIKIGEKKLQFLGKTINISNPAVLLKGRVYLPIRTISEAFGKKVHWKKENGKVTVYIAERGK